MIDPFGREVSYLRVSVTDRCDFRCVYCMAEHMTFLPRAELLTLEELERLCGAFIDKGVRRLRITGGEPLVQRPDLPPVLASKMCEWVSDALKTYIARKHASAPAISQA
ncbi:MAG TPA: radical SAM protein, partial [Rhizomicrobium sp.]